MKIFELQESRVAELDELYRQAEKLAYDEAHDQHHGVSGDRILAIAKQLIHNEVRDPAIASSMIDAVADRIHREHTFEGDVIDFKSRRPSSPEDNDTVKLSSSFLDSVKADEEYWKRERGPKGVKSYPDDFDQRIEQLGQSMGATPEMISRVQDHMRGLQQQGDAQDFDWSKWESYIKDGFDDFISGESW